MLWQFDGLGRSIDQVVKQVVIRHDSGETPLVVEYKESMDFPATDLVDRHIDRLADMDRLEIDAHDVAGGLLGMEFRRKFSSTMFSSNAYEVSSADHAHRSIILDDGDVMTSLVDEQLPDFFERKVG